MSHNGSVNSHHITLSGEYDIARKGELSEAVASLTNGEALTLDMSDVTYVDSTFLNELTSMRLQSRARTVILLGVHSNVARILEIAKLDRFFVFQ